MQSKPLNNLKVNTSSQGGENWVNPSEEVTSTKICLIAKISYTNEFQIVKTVRLYS